jgi:hypothetical protein
MKWGLTGPISPAMECMDLVLRESCRGLAEGGEIDYPKIFQVNRPENIFSGFPHKPVFPFVA